MGGGGGGGGRAGEYFPQTLLQSYKTPDWLELHAGKRCIAHSYEVVQYSIISLRDAVSVAHFNFPLMKIVDIDILCLGRLRYI